MVWAVRGHGRVRSASSPSGPAAANSPPPAGTGRSASGTSKPATREIDTLAGHTEPVNSVAYSPDGRLAGLRVQRPNGPHLGRRHRHRDPASSAAFERRVSAVAVSPDGQTLGVGRKRRDGTALGHGHMAGAGRFAETHLRRAGVAFSPDGRLLASAGDDWTVRLWRTADGEEIATFRGHADRVHGLSFSPDGRLLASAGYDGAVKLWDVADLEQ